MVRLFKNAVPSILLCTGTKIQWRDSGFPEDHRWPIEEWWMMLGDSKLEVLAINQREARNVVKHAGTGTPDDGDGPVLV